VALVNQERLSGVYCAALTPLEDDGRASLELLDAHLHSLLEAGCAGIVLLGTTGEANSFTVDERTSILDAVIARGFPPDRLIVGTGCCATGDTVALTKHALACGVTRVLMLPPFYYKNLADEGIADAFARTIEAVGDERLRIYLYQIPQLTGVSFTPSVIELLLQHQPDAIAGIKDSSGDWAAINQLCSRFGARIDVLVGSERFLLDALRAGATGCVTATANANPASICELYERRESEDATHLQELVTASRSVFERYPMIAALKEVCAQRSGDARWRNLRAPLTRLAPDARDALAAGVAPVGRK
jgi:4-hydroxy-tetrahydrodipicolinate synthase